MSLSPVKRILIVDDEPDWLGLLTRLFPEHIVDAVQSFAEALRRVESPGQHYDAALVDLNLLNQHDRLGGAILESLHRNSPSTLRIAMTGTRPEGSMRREILDQYHVEDVFIKPGRLADLREIVLGSPSGPPPDMSADPALETLRKNLQLLRSTVLGGLNQQIADLQNDLRFSGRSRSVQEDDLVAELERLRSLRDAFVHECARVEEMLDATGSGRNGEAAAEALADLTQRWEATRPR
jgi:CheY-like chemotaxis protein